VGAGLVGDEVGAEAAAEQLGQDLRAVADEADRHRLAVFARVLRPPDRLVEIRRLAVEVPRLDPALDPRRVDVDAERDTLVHRHGERLRAAHAAEPAGERDRALERAAEPLRAGLGERLVRALEDPLRPDVDPRAGRHLAVHGQALVLELAERVPVRPLRHEHRVRDEHARRLGVRPEDRDRLARLDEHRLVALEPAERPDDRVERLPRARRAPGPAVHDEVLRPLGHVGVEVVHQHAQRGLLRPRLARALGPSRRPDLAGHAVLLRGARSLQPRTPVFSGATARAPRSLFSPRTPGR
jgi:hypothetical protein